MSTSSTKKTAWFGMKVTPEQKEKIKKLARRRGVSQTQAILDLVEKELESENKKTIKARPGSMLDRNKDLFGAGNSGKHDLSTNPKYMEGFGE